MAFDLATARVRIGLSPTDTSKDSQLTAALNTATSLAERYCDRVFGYSAAATEEFPLFAAREIQLSRFPIVTVSSVTADQTAISNYQIAKNAGMILFDGGSVSALLLSVTYAGGYQTLPPDLELALWMIFDAVWPTIAGVSGAGSSSGSISRVTIPDVGSISFDTGAAQTGLNGLVPDGAAAILDLYRRPSC